MSQAEKVAIHCHGGCGRSVTLHKNKVHQADYNLCHSRQDGSQCEANLPSLQPGKIRAVDMHAAVSFWGYRDVWPDAQQAAAVMRAREILAAGVAQMAIEKVRRCN